MFKIYEEENATLVRITDFLPDFMIKEIYKIAIKFKDKFSFPSWASPTGEKVNNRSSLCSALDLWFPIKKGSQKKAYVPAVMYELVEKYMFHQGIIDFCSHTNQEIFRLLPNQSPNGRIHMICYGNNDFYGWHKDYALPEGQYLYGLSPRRNNLFTFNLNLCLDKKMSGGDLLFQKDNTTHVIPFMHNSLTIMPSTVAHAVTEVSKVENTEWINRRFSIQFWMAGTPFHSTN